MKKNVKYLGMAAAALLAVAPVVSTGVASAATTVPVTVTGSNAQQPGQAQNVTVSLSVANVNAIENNANASSLQVSLVSNIGTPKINGNKGQALVYKSTDVTTANGIATVREGAKAQNTLTQGESYVVVANNVTLTGLSTTAPSTTVNGQPATVNTYGNATNNNNGWNIASPVFTVPNKTLTGTPYVIDTNNQTQNSGSVNLSSANNKSTVNDLATAIVAKYKPAVDGTSTVYGWTAESIASEVKSSLVNAGVSVNDNGEFTIPAAGFNVTLTAAANNGKSSQFVVRVNPTINANYSANPVFSYNGTNYDHSQNVKLADNASFNYVPVNGHVDVNAIKAAFTAKVSANSADTIVPTVDVSKVNTAVPGVYPVTVSATNANGHTTTLTFDLTVGDKNTTYRTVNYVEGYSVFAWNLNGNNKPSISTTKFLAGTKVGTEGSKVTVDGVAYYKIAGQNLYIQAQYVDGSWKPATKPSHNDASKEEKVSGVAKVVYNGRGGVKLLNGKGEYQSQVVKNGTAWKVFAKKTINGKTYYRIGNDNQWIPAQYVNFR